MSCSALVICFSTVLTLMPSNSAIFWWDKPSILLIANTLALCPGILSTAIATEILRSSKSVSSSVNALNSSVAEER